MPMFTIEFGDLALAVSTDPKHETDPKKDEKRKKEEEEREWHPLPMHITAH